ncbi:hypothetical protein BP5796_09836 [Coleophoma crateriformis]|uniref:Enoyl reductase (ER) domain-containing protein n=1 Tax=Coleophoma crateriformis TaxID=565419 RepID=A0A3D8QUF4_9HELO|nr:hypothetical protein BP5796_09836 [Coleophoma crateriformis]
MSTYSLPTTMRALIQPDRNSTHLKLVTLPVPQANLESDEHLIRVHTTALTNGELLWPKNFASIPEEPAKANERIPSYDVAGTVITAPANSPFRPGDEVYARTSYFRRGCARDYTIGVTGELAKRPQRFSWPQSATVPMSAQTAWQALFIHAGLKPEAGTGAQGKRVFVTAASGGVGTWVVQLARWAGAEVVGTCGPANVDYVKSLGAFEAIDYRSTNIKEWASDAGKKAEVVIDCIGDKSLADAWWVVKDGGVLISVYQPPEQMKPAATSGSGIRNLFFVMEADGDQLGKVTKLIDEGGFVTGLDKVFQLEHFQKALERLESGKTRGKVVLDLIL